MLVHARTHDQPGARDERAWTLEQIGERMRGPSGVQYLHRMTGPANISSRRVPKQQRSRQMVEAVLAAVPVAVKRYGTTSITTNRIAEVAGVSIGSLYQYFPNKVSIFNALHERHVEDARRILQRFVTEQSSSAFSGSVIGLVEELVDLHCADREMHQLHSASACDRPEQFRCALRGALENATNMRDTQGNNCMLFVLPSLIEGVVHGVALSPFRSSEAKGEAVKAVRSYLSSQPGQGR